MRDPALQLLQTPQTTISTTCWMVDIRNRTADGQNFHRRSAGAISPDALAVRTNSWTRRFRSEWANL